MSHEPPDSPRSASRSPASACRSRTPEARGRNFAEVNLGLDADRRATARPCAASSAPSPHCVDGLPGGREDPRVRRRSSAGRLPGRGGQDARGQRPAGHHRPRLPAGGPVRGRLRARQEAARRSPSATSSASWPTGSAQTGALGLPPIAPPTGKKVAIVGSGPAGPRRRRRPGPAGPRRDASSRPCTRSAACWSTASPSSACPRTIVRQEVENLRRWASSSRPTS